MFLKSHFLRLVSFNKKNLFTHFFVDILIEYVMMVAGIMNVSVH